MKDFTNFISFIRRYEIIIASVAILLVVIILSYIFLLPNFASAQQIFSEQKRLKGKIEILKHKDNLLSSIDFQYYKDIYTKLNYILPSEKNYVSLFQTMDDLEKKSGVAILRTDFQLGTVSVKGEKPTSASKSESFIIPITIKVVGDLSSIQKFLQAINDLSGRYLILTETDLDLTQPDLYQITFSGTAYFYPTPQTLGKIETPLPKLEQEEEAITKKIAQVKVISEEKEESVPTGKKNLFQ